MITIPELIKKDREVKRTPIGKIAIRDLVGNKKRVFGGGKITIESLIRKEGREPGGEPYGYKI
jgi:hypothetical protein